jgi:hypothetical protein
MAASKKRKTKKAAKGRSGGKLGANLKLLADAHIFDPRRLTPQEMQAIEQLDPADVEALLRVHKQLGGPGMIMPFICF